jgi:hypothetical protein
LWSILAETPISCKRILQLQLVRRCCGNREIARGTSPCQETETIASRTREVAARRETETTIETMTGTTTEATTNPSPAAAV